MENLLQDAHGMFCTKQYCPTSKSTSGQLITLLSFIGHWPQVKSTTFAAAQDQYFR